MHARAVEGEAERIRGLFRGVERDADALVLCGDLTDHGRGAEAEVLLRGLDGLGIPILAVLGNHDHESAAATGLLRMLEAGGIQCLDRETRTSLTLDGVGFAGVKGYGGGFEPAIVRAFGEETLKAFVSESIIEAEALRGALKSLDARVKVAITHYSPVEATLEGESMAIRPFLGTSRLSRAIEEGGAMLALHGHAHHGRLEGATPGGVPVWNVSIPVLRASGRKEAWRVFEA